jgi:integrase
MARAVKRLSARAAATITRPGRHADGAGLYLFVSKSGETLRRRWVFRYAWQGRVREMGLGSPQTVPLARARELADAARRELTDGRDPIASREAAREAFARVPTFGECADALIEAKSAEWRNAKHAAQWRMTLTEYAAPLRSAPVDEIDTEAVLSVLQPIWTEKPETAARLRGRIEAVLDAARAQGHVPRNDANPARWRGHLDKLLPKRQVLSRGHHAAMSYQDAPSFIRELREREAVAALALEFCILTATRSGEVFGAQWPEVDLSSGVWSIPAARMKAARAHRVPLSRRALEILERLAAARVGDFIFPGQRAGKPLSGMAMEMLLRRMGADDVTVHGFRSAFRDWAGNETDFPRELAEAALAHVIGDKAEQAYRRSDALEKRRALMDAWAAFLEPKAEDGASVLAFKKSVSSA